MRAKITVSQRWSRIFSFAGNWCTEPKYLYKFKDSFQQTRTYSERPESALLPHQPYQPWDQSSQKVTWESTIPSEGQFSHLSVLCILLALCFLHLQDVLELPPISNLVFFLVLCHCVDGPGQPSTDGCPSCFRYFTILNNATVNQLLPLPYHTCAGLFVG